jgi:hypothetical protein
MTRTSLVSRAALGSGNARRLGAVVVAVGVLLLGVVWLLAAPRTPPLFDGVGFPDEPYRYVVAPAGAAPTKAVTSASASVPIQSGKSRSVSVMTAEQGPQASLFLAAAAVLTTGAPTSVEVRLTPLAPPSTPADGTIPGDAYAVSGAAEPSGTTAISGATNAATVMLRIPKATSQTVAIELLTAGRWEQLTTFKTGTDVYSANLPAFGTVAAVIVTDPSRAVEYAGAHAPSKGGGGGIALGPLLAGIVVLLLVVLVVGVRIARRRRGEPAGALGADDPP